MFPWRRVSVSMSVCHAPALCKNGWTFRCPVWGEEGTLFSTGVTILLRDGEGGGEKLFPLAATGGRERTRRSHRLITLTSCCRFRHTRLHPIFIRTAVST